MDWNTDLALDGPLIPTDVTRTDVTRTDVERPPQCVPSAPTVVDSTTKNMGTNTSIDVDSRGNAHIAYYDAYNNDLRYATNVSDAWQTDTIDSQEIVGLVSSIRVDTSDKVHVAYYKASFGDLKYATNKSGSWEASTVDSSGDVGRPCSMDVDSAGAVHIGYFDRSNINGQVLSYTTNASGSWKKETVASQLLGITDSMSLRLDTAGKVHIAFLGQLGLQYATNASGAWQTTVVDADNQIFTLSMALDPGGRCHISYSNMTSTYLKYATSTSGTWALQTLDTRQGSNAVGNRAALACDRLGGIHVSWSYEGLRYYNNISGSWKSASLDAQKDAGYYSSLAVDLGGRVHISYHDAAVKTLKYVAVCPLSLP